MVLNRPPEVPGWWRHAHSTVSCLRSNTTGLSCGQPSPHPLSCCLRMSRGERRSGPGLRARARPRCPSYQADHDTAQGPDVRLWDGVEVPGLRMHCLPSREHALHVSGPIPWGGPLRGEIRSGLRGGKACRGVHMYGNGAIGLYSVAHPGRPRGPRRSQSDRYHLFRHKASKL